jgi:spore maturation protein CgeB
MRILMVHPGASFSVADVHHGWLEAFQGLGVQVASLNLHERLAFYSSAGRLNDDGVFVKSLTDGAAARLAAKGIEAACFEMWPDVCLVTSCFFVPPETLDVIRSRGIKVVLLHTEQPYETDRELALAARADLNLLNDPTHLERFQAVAPSVYAPHAYRPSLHHPGPPDPKLAADFCFIGTGFPSRVAFLERVDWTGIDAVLGGMWQMLTGSPLRKLVGHDIDVCMDNTETADAYRSAKVGANLYRTEGDASVTDGWAMGPREVEMAACGLFFLRESRGEGDDVLSMLPRFSEPAEFGDLIRWHLAHPAVRRDLADRARAAVAGRTFASNARMLLGLLEHL